MGVEFARTFTQQALLDAWQDVREAALADGRPDAEVQQFEADAARRVAHLAVALAEGEWRPLPAHQLEIAKPSGGIRRLTIPPLADRVVERALLVTLDREIDPSLLPWSFYHCKSSVSVGARKNRSMIAVLEESTAIRAARSSELAIMVRLRDAPRWVRQMCRAVLPGEPVAVLVEHGVRVARRGDGDW